MTDFSRARSLSWALRLLSFSFVLSFSALHVSGKHEVTGFLNGNPEDVSIRGYVGDQINKCIEHRVKAQDVHELVEPFRKQDESYRWQTEFFGKWLLGAISSYDYTHDPALFKLIKSAADSIMTTQLPDGYIGNYSPAARLTAWDIWGRKYTTLSLLSYYRLTGEEKALKAAQRVIDHLIAELNNSGTDIADTGNYFGMASCSVLEPVVYLYNLTHDSKYLDFAKSILASIEKEGHSRLVAKALDGVPVSRRSPFPRDWWSYTNGMKAYEMMSCYEGLIELSKVIDDPLLIKAAERTVDSILADEINIAGSGAAFECWYGGKLKQTVPAYHTMETCVTFTWMQLCARLLEVTGDTRYADEFERTMYNALMASMRADGSQIAKYSPLEGCRTAGEEQCGMHINCCNANGPRAFALIPKVAYTSENDRINVNLYIPSDATVNLGKNKIGLRMETDYPVSGDIELTVNPARSADFTMSLRMPTWLDSAAVVAVNGEIVQTIHKGGYLDISRRWDKGDKVSVHLPLTTKVVRMGDPNRFQAVTRGPVVFARDSRYNDGDVDETSVIVADENGVIDASPAPGKFSWLTMEVPMVLGTDLEDPAHARPEMIHFCDFGSAGNDWNKASRYRVWLPQTLHQMQSPYHKY